MAIIGSKGSWDINNKIRRGNQSRVLGGSLERIVDRTEGGGKIGIPV